MSPGVAVQFANPTLQRKLSVAQTEHLQAAGAGGRTARGQTVNVARRNCGRWTLDGAMKA